MLIDPRSVANLIIEEAGQNNKIVTNLSIQKILYFIQGRFLIEKEEPLISGYFEAWKFGPVHPLIYDTFRYRGAQPLTELAFSKDIITGEIKIIRFPENENLKSYICDTALRYLNLSPGRLVELSHAPGSPWDILTKSQDGRRSFGLRITNDLIRERFKHHKVTVNQFPIAGEPDEESPPN